MTGEQSPVVGHPSAWRTVVGNICVCVRDIKELFRFVLREPLVPGLLRWELRLTSAYSRLLHSVIQERKGCFPLLKRCRASGWHRPLGNDRTHHKRQGGRFHFLTRGRHTQRNAIFKTSVSRARWQNSLPPEVVCDVMHNRAAERVRASLQKRSIFQVRAGYVISIFRLKVKEQISQVMNS